jgi:AcrR family transcriptional regulator
MRRVKTNPRKAPRQDRSKVTVDAILDATAHVLVTDGYDQTSTNRVALRAGVSIGSLYQYFPNKEALVGELVDRFSSQILELLLNGLRERAELPPEELARELVSAMVRIKRRDPNLARVLREQIPRVGRMQRYEKELDQLILAVEAYFERWRERLRHDDLAMAAFVAVHAADAATHAGVTRRPHVSDEVLIDHATDLVLSYLLKEPTRPASRGGA